ncbi:hypothetical protein E2562_038265 [Oryza meyeriana var. granulata]|uniref:TFIIS N-terminal domain-containing protein n=1 Tax=Oryza meyeriana var. granulata TaxID=110450 RepID=A0A6G1F216_9ORYZ|nr:hypothetical protein E2562_038265 [Oryza meyeriana var. granulata]
MAGGIEEAEGIKSKPEGGEDGGRPSSSPSEEAVVELLRALQAVPMTFQTLEATMIGKTISGLRKHSSEQVCDLAAALYKNWKALVNEHLARSSSSKPPAPTKTASALAAVHQAKKANTAAAHRPVPAAAPKTTACNKRKDETTLPDMDEAKLDAARKKLKERYREVETAKTQRKIQMINAPGKARQLPVVVERQRVVRDTVVGVASRAPVRPSLRM